MKDTIFDSNSLLKESNAQFVCQESSVLAGKPALGTYSRLG